MTVETVPGDHEQNREFEKQDRMRKKGRNALPWLSFSLWREEKMLSGIRSSVVTTCLNKIEF